MNAVRPSAQSRISRGLTPTKFDLQELLSPIKHLDSAEVMFEKDDMIDRVNL